jgi:glucose/arabinose dehydrogenase
LISSLKAQEVRLLTIENRRVLHQEVILEGAGRVREAVPSPDGAIYLVMNGPDRIVRLRHLADFTTRSSNG